eukprot:gene24741-30104_t
MAEEPPPPPLLARTLSAISAFAEAWLPRMWSGGGSALSPTNEKYVETDDENDFGVDTLAATTLPPAGATKRARPGSPPSLGSAGGVDGGGAAGAGAVSSDGAVEDTAVVALMIHHDENEVKKYSTRPMAVTEYYVYAKFGSMAPFILPGCEATLTEPEAVTEKQEVLQLKPGHPLVTITMPCGLTALEHFRELATDSPEAARLFEAIWELLDAMNHSQA